MTEPKIRFRHDQFVTFLADHPVAEKLIMLAMGMASFTVFFLPILWGASWMERNDVHLPFFGPDWLYVPNVILRVLYLFGPSVLCMVLIYRYVIKTLEPAVKLSRRSMAQA